MQMSSEKPPVRHLAVFQEDTAEGHRGLHCGQVERKHTMGGYGSKVEWTGAWCKKTNMERLWGSTCGSGEGRGLVPGGAVEGIASRARTWAHIRQLEHLMLMN